MKKYVLFICGILLLIAPILVSAASVDPLIPVACSGDQYNNQCDLCQLLQLVINISKYILGLTGIATLLMLVYAGAVFLTAYGREERIKWGKEIIIAAITGIFIIFTAWIIINTLIMGLTGGKFTITSLLNGEGMQCGGDNQTNTPDQPFIMRDQNGNSIPF